MIEVGAPGEQQQPVQGFTPGRKLAALATMSVLNSTHDSDRLIRELMVKNKDLSDKCKHATAGAEKRAAALQQAQGELAAAAQQVQDARNEAHELNKQLAKARLEFDDKVCCLLMLSAALRVPHRAKRLGTEHAAGRSHRSRPAHRGSLRKLRD